MNATLVEAEWLAAHLEDPVSPSRLILIFSPNQMLPPKVTSSWAAAEL